MAAATLYSVFLKDWDLAGRTAKGYEMIVASSQNTLAFIVGNVVAFVVAILAIRLFIGYLQDHGFRWFGYYRIIVGLILLLLLYWNVL
jgi:undecaprenyl-diphosphatase